MKRIFQLLTIFSLAVLLTGVLAASKTSAEGGSCYLKALRTDVFVKVYDLKRNGDMGSLLWVGRVNYHRQRRWLDNGYLEGTLLLVADQF